MSALLDVFLQPFARWRFSQRSRFLANVPKPQDAPRTFASGPDADRILVFGSGAAVGWGVRTHDLGFAGHLGREVAERTGRGARVDIHARAELLAVDASRLVSGIRTERYEAVVVVLGSIDALVRIPVAQFRRALSEVVDNFLAASPASTRIVLVGVPPLSVVPAFSGFLGNLADARALELNDAAAEIAASRARVSYVSLPTQAADAGRYRSSDDYRAWARLVAAEVTVGLAASSPKQSSTRTPFDHFSSPARLLQYDSARTHRAEPQDETARLAASRALGLVGAPSNPRIDKIVDEVRHVFGTPYAAFTVVGNTTQWNSSQLGFDQREIPIENSFCAITIQDEGALILADTSRDERYAGDGSYRFYAGFPVESPSGYRIGAVCVFDADPRPAETVDAALLGSYAHKIERELWDLSVA